MARVLGLLCSSLILVSFVHHVTAQQQRRRPKTQHPFAGFGFRPSPPSGSQIRLRGLCRDGWVEGTSQDLYGKEIQICIKINDKEDTWEGAKRTCRQDFGFLLKLDSPVKVDGHDLMSVVLSKGITSLWTGVHTENSHLIWDDIAPSQLTPNNFNQSNPRPWEWTDEDPSKLSEYCGKLSIDQDEERERKKRKKRQILNFDTSESDSNDRLFGSSESMFGLNSGFDSSQSRNDGYPQASAFQEMLTRTQFNDRLAELPTAALGVPSAQQLPGSGLSGANLQKGGLATVSPLYAQTTAHSDSDSDKDLTPTDPLDLLKNTGNLGFQSSNNGHNINPQSGILQQVNFNQGQLFNHPSPTDGTSLVDSVRDHAEKLGISNHLPDPSPTDMLESLSDQFNGQSSESSDTKQDVLGLLAALNQDQGNDNPDIKSHDVLNIASPGMFNVNPIDQSRVDPALQTQAFMDSFNGKDSDVNKDFVNPTTVSPFMKSFIGQNMQNTDDSSTLSDSIKDLLHDVTNTDSSNKELSDSAKEVLQTLQPGVPHYSETIESLADKLSGVKDAGLTTPANNLFDGNVKLTGVSNRDDIDNLPNMDPISNSQFVPDTSDDIKKDTLTSDSLFPDHDKIANFDGIEDIKSSSDDQNNINLPPFSDTDDQLSDNLKNDFANSFNNNAKITSSGISNITSSTGDISDDESDKLKDSVLDISSEDGFSNDASSSDIIANSDDSEKTDQSLHKNILGITSDKDIETNLGIETSDESGVKKDVISPSVSSDANPSIPSIVSNLDIMQSDDDLNREQIVENDVLKFINTKSDKENLTNEIESSDDEQKDKTSNDNTENVHPSIENFDQQKEIAENLKDYLSLTNPSTDDFNDDQTQETDVSQTDVREDSIKSVDNDNIVTRDSDNPEKQESKSDTETVLGNVLEQKDSMSPETDIEDQSLMVSSDKKQIQGIYPELNDEDGKADDIIDSGTARVVDALENGDKEDLDIQNPIPEAQEDLNGSDQLISETLDVLNAEDDQISKMDSEPDDEIEQLLKDIQQNITENENDDENNATEVFLTESEDNNETDENNNNIQAENIDIDDTVGVDDIPEKHTKDEILIDNDTLSELIDRDSENIAESDNERNLSDGSDLLENYDKLMGNNRQDATPDDNDQTEDADDNTEVNKAIETDKAGEVEEPENTTDTENGIIDDAFENVQEMLGNEETNVENDALDDMPELAEVLLPENEKTAILPAVGEQEMELSTCRQKLPSVCFSYQLEVMKEVSTCEKGWYGHILHNKCYRILSKKQNYRAATAQCATMGGDIVAGQSDFERMFTLLAVSMDGKLFRGTKFWKQSDKKGTCQFYDESGVKEEPNCGRALNAICQKQAIQTDLNSGSNPQETEMKVFMTGQNDANLPCGLTSTTNELPVVWFKDGMLVSAISSADHTDPSLKLNRDLVQSIREITNRDMSFSALQGRYWCEVWDSHSTAGAPARRRSNSYDLRFADVMSFHGSMELKHYSYKDGALFNFMDKTFPSLAATETDLKRVFRDVLPVLRGTLDFVKSVYTHVDSVRSSPKVLEYHTFISLTRNYTLEDEINVYNRLKGLLRAVLGNAQYMSKLPGRTPVTTFRTMALQSTVSCPAAELRTNNIKTIAGKVFKFRHALLGEQVDSNETCSKSDLRPAGSASCLGDFYTGAYWGNVKANECTPLPEPINDDDDDEEEEDINEEPIDAFNKDIWGKTPQTDTLSEMAMETVDETNAENITGRVAKITQEAVTFTPTDINKIADVLEHTTEVAKVTPEVGENIIKTVDKLMTVSEKEVEVANVETKAANRIIKSLEKCAEKVDMTERDNFRLVTDNIALEVWMLKDDSRPVIGLAAHSDDMSSKKVFKNEDIATVFNKSQLFDANVDAAIELPKEAFESKVKGQPARNKLTMIVFRKSKLFEMAAKSGDGKALNMDKSDISQLNSYVISASIAGKKLTDLKDKVRTIFKPLKEEDGSNQNCVFWDFNLNEQKGGWSNEGCIYDGRINGREVCLCDHLTNFAVLLDFYGQENPIHQDHELSLSIITIVGLSFSILGLALTIVSFVFFKKLRQGRAQQTLFNLAVALLCAMMMFLVGIKQTHHYWLCLITAVMLHYFILASFMWMLMEAILQYLTFVKILGTYITRFTLKTVIPAWGLPLIPVIIILSIDYTLYKGGEQYCWMSLPAFYYGFAIPISCIIVINVVIFIITIVSIFRRGKGLRSNQKKKKVAITNLQAAITSFILLGLSWLFGYLAIADARLPFQYIFTILNSLQGFFIFILFVVRKKKVREQWYIICCQGQDKEKVSRSLSASNSIPSSYSNGSSRRNSKLKGKERDRSDSTKTVTSSLSSAGSFSNGFTNLGYDTSFDMPYNRRTYRNF